MDIKSLNPVVKSFLVGSFSGTCSTILFQPLDLLKTRIQAPTSVRNGASGIFTVAGNILRTEKLFGLWKGMTPSLTRCVPGVGLYFASIHWIQILAGIEDHPTALQSMAVGACGRCLSGAILIPFTVIKTRFESKVYQYGSIREALRVIYKYEGVRGLTCGLLPTLLRDAPFSGLYLMMYSGAKQKVSPDWIESNTFGPYVRFSCGIVAGFGDVRNIILLVQQVGLTPLQAIRVYSTNPALFLNMSSTIGKLVPGFTADAVLVSGDIMKDITCINNNIITFKSGVQYDSKTLLQQAFQQVR